MRHLASPPLPAAGHYPTPDHGRKHVVERAWDGDVWLPEFRPAPAGTTLPAYRRHPFAFLRHWRLLLAWVVFAGVATALWAHDRQADWVSGI